MVQMVSASPKRTYAFGDALDGDETHIKYRHRQKPYRDNWWQAFVPTLRKFDGEPGQEQAKHHAAGVAHEDACAIAARDSGVEGKKSRNRGRHYEEKICRGRLPE